MRLNSEPWRGPLAAVLAAAAAVLTCAARTPAVHSPRALAPLGIASFGPPAMTPPILNKAGASLWLGGSQINFSVQNGFRSGFLPSLNVGKMLASQGGCSGDCVHGGALNHDWIDRTAALAVKSTGSPGGWYVVGNEVEDSFSDDVAPTQAAYGVQLDAWVAALRAHDPEAHIVGPNFTTWDAKPNIVAYPWGPPQRWWRLFLRAYRAAHRGRKPRFAALSFHDYLPVNQPPSTTTLDHFAAQARVDGYPASVWITESAVNFLQPASQPLSASQQTVVTTFIHGLRADPHAGRVYYFTEAYPGFDNVTGDHSSLRSVYDAESSPTEVAAALRATGSSERG